MLYSHYKFGNGDKMKLDYSTTETRTIDAYNAALSALEASAKEAENSEYNRLRSAIPSPYESDWPETNFVKETISEIVFESRKKKAKKSQMPKFPLLILIPVTHLSVGICKQMFR